MFLYFFLLKMYLSYRQVMSKVYMSELNFCESVIITVELKYILYS